MSDSAKVTAEQRFSRLRPCPICGGHAGLPSGQGIRCWGFASNDGRFVHCTREEHAGGLQPHPKTNAYVHKMGGNCGCGISHNGHSALGLKVRNHNGRVGRHGFSAGGEGTSPPSDNRENPENGENPRIYRENSENDSGCTVAAYAEYVQLPEDYLREAFDLKDVTYMGSPAVRIRYTDETGSEESVRFRLKLHKGGGVDARFKQRKGDRMMPYGLWGLPEAS